MPTSTDVACITVPGTYTVTFQPSSGSETVDALSLGSGVLGDQETLALNGTCSDNVSLKTTNASSGTDTDLIASTGHLSLTNSVCGDSSALTIGTTLVNQGILSTDGGGGTRTITGNVTNDAAADINASFTFDSGTWDNAGALDIADGNTFTVNTSPATFTNDTGGSVVSSGTSHTGQLVIDASDTYNQGNGTTSGEPVFLNGPPSGAGITLHYTGTGASTIVAQGAGDTLDGNIVAGQTLSVQGTCSNDATETLLQSLTNAGTINLTNVTCGNSASMVVAGGDTLTNTGTLETTGGGGNRTITGNVTNQGTVSIGSNATFNSGTWDNQGALDIADSTSLAVNTSPATFTNDTGGSVVSSGTSHTGQLVIDASDTYNQGNGTTSGEPVFLNGPPSGAGIALHYTGTGASTIVAQGAGDTLDGTIVAGQTLSVQGTCSNNATVTVDHSESSSGVVNLTRGDVRQHRQPDDDPGDTFTNAAPARSTSSAGRRRWPHLTGKVTNKGTVNIASTAPTPPEPGPTKVTSTWPTAPT